MKELRIKDNSFENRMSFSEIMSVVKAVADKTLGQLDREGIFIFPEIFSEAEDLTKEQMILQSVNDSFQAGNIMGFLGVGDERLIITSRFSSGNNDFLFQYLLERVLDFPNIVNMDADAREGDQLFNLLLFLFPKYLKYAMRKGIFKTYIRNRYNDRNPKGSMDIPRHIRQNIPFVGNIAYSQREYSYDNYLLELIRHTVEYIKDKPYGKKILNQAKDEVRLVMDVTSDYSIYDRKRIIEKNKRTVIRHAYFREYRALQQLCILILQNRKHQIGVGARRAYGLLYDGTWLWEEYINLLLGEFFYHPMNKSKLGGQYLFAGNKGKIYPDFISRDTENRIIVDAKYKPVNNIRDKDYLQVLAYMFRFEAKQGFYFYPEIEDENKVSLWLNKGSSYEGKVESDKDICVTKYGLKIPKDIDCYDDFVKEIKLQEEEFRSEFLVTTKKFCPAGGWSDE